MALLLQPGIDGPALILLALLLALSWAVTYIALRLTMRRNLESLRAQLHETQDHVATLARSLEDQRVQALQPIQPPAPAASTTAAAVSVTPEKDSISPDVLVILAAAVTAYLGKRVRIRSAQLLQTPYELFNPWAQQGRAVIQASHNLPQRAYRE